MFSDTHFHFQLMAQRTSQQEATEVLEQMAKNRIFFALDVGTKCDDLSGRIECVQSCIDAITDANLRSKLKKSIRFSAGIWPDVDSIRERESCLETLQSQIEDFLQDGGELKGNLVAIGEGGIDHHWNTAGADAHSEEDFDKETLAGERELFAMQLDLAHKMALPFIVHSREGFSDTLDVIKSSKCRRGIIHCFSYGVDEAKAFLELGFHLAFGGAVTYTKKSRMEDMVRLLSFVPKDRLLLETDSPYLAPVPFRGGENNPLLIRHVYEFISDKLSISTDKLCRIVDENCATLFKLKY